jgi:hypothetical protein
LTDNSRGGDLWALDLESDTWSVVSTSGPAPRDGAILVYIASQVRLILFGGTTPDGNGGDTWSMTLESPTTAVASETTLPVSSSLAVYPNPFNASVTLELQLHEVGKLIIYDTLGRRVRDLGTLPIGSARRLWNGRDDEGRAVGSGVYLAVLQSPHSRQVQRLALLR